MAVVALSSVTVGSQRELFLPLGSLSVMEIESQRRVQAGNGDSAKCRWLGGC